MYIIHGRSRDFEIGGARYKGGQKLGGPTVCMFCPVSTKYDYSPVIYEARGKSLLEL